MTRSEQFDRALDRLSADQSPRHQLSGLSAHELRMIHLAQILCGTRLVHARKHAVNQASLRLLSHHLAGISGSPQRPWMEHGDKVIKP